MEADEKAGQGHEQAGQRSSPNGLRITVLDGFVVPPRQQWVGQRLEELR
jgi:hypothetical protein